MVWWFDTMPNLSQIAAELLGRGEPQNLTESVKSEVFSPNARHVDMFGLWYHVLLIQGQEYP